MLFFVVFFVVTVSGTGLPTKYTNKSIENMSGDTPVWTFQGCSQISRFRHFLVVGKVDFEPIPCGLGALQSLSCNVNSIVFVVESAAALKDFYYLLLISRFLDFAKIKPDMKYWIIGI